ncbi:MAG: hypothetical protein AMK73_10180 [Planctomycetes bacterium SM23_32]|nr:MAG: hypothetical protein AMK73_10180 [Planctomycetes bacterium SM23_32]
MVNRGLCPVCGDLVLAEREERDGRVLLVKHCPRCGRSEVLVSSDAERYRAKRGLDAEHEEPRGCALNCLTCTRKKSPGFVFVDITNRCNANCPICINNTPAMGFLFEPPLDYFEKVFRFCASLDPKPAVQLFGGEPTVRRDLLDIIAMARSYGLPTRVVTNGLRLADEDYCRRLVESRATVLIAYDGANPRIYGVLRGNEKYLETKRQALDNLRKLGARKVALMTCVAWGFNDEEMPELLRFCHDRRDFIRGVYFMPLAETWSPEVLDLHPPRMTTEDIEHMVAACYPDTPVSFVPAGVIGGLHSLLGVLTDKRPPFAGAHPNCESMYLLLSDGERYLPVEHFLKGSINDAFADLIKVNERFAALRGGQGKPRGLRGAYLRLRALLALTGLARRHLRVAALMHGRGLGKVWHTVRLLAGLLTGGRSGELARRHTRWGDVFQIGTLPERVRLLRPRRRPGPHCAGLRMGPVQDARYAPHRRPLRGPPSGSGLRGVAVHPSSPTARRALARTGWHGPRRVL